VKSTNRRFQIFLVNDNRSIDLTGGNYFFSAQASKHFAENAHMRVESLPTCLTGKVFFFLKDTIKYAPPD